MSTTNSTPALRLPFCAALRGTPHLQEGLLGKINASGEIELATSADDAFGVICDPDGYATAVAGNITSATLVHRKFSGIIKVKIASTTAAITPGTKLIFGEGGVFDVPGTSSTATPLAVAVEAAASEQAGQMVNVILL